MSRDVPTRLVLVGELLWPKSLHDRLVAKCVEQGDCLVWTGTTDHRGYGVTWAGSRTDGTGRNRRTHVLMWEYHHGARPAGMFVCHHCDNPSCIRIEHLFLGTPGDNARDMAAKGRHWKQQVTHCPQGHEYSSENTRMSRDGRRSCKTCAVTRTRDRRRARRAAS